MKIEGTGWELLVTRLREDRRGTNRRTVGRYQVYHDGKPVAALSGMCVETRGPGDNSKADNNRRIEARARRYPLKTFAGDRYMTFGYKEKGKRPCFEVDDTSPRYDILVHPGHGFKASVGCINPSKALPNAASVMNLSESLPRVVAMIEDMKSFLGSSFPKTNGKSIPNAWLVVDGEPEPE
jgi:hypothetical protein